MTSCDSLGDSVAGEEAGEGSGEEVVEPWPGWPESHGMTNAAIVAENKPHYIFRVNLRCWCRGKLTNNKDSQRQGADLHLFSEVRVSSHHVPPRSVRSRLRVGLKCQKNRTVVGKFGLGQTEEDSVRLLP